MIFQLTNNQLHKTIQVVEPRNVSVTVYEVMRIINGVPLFFDDHYSRLLKSISLVKRKIMLDKKTIFIQLCELFKRSNVDTGNLMFKVYFFEDYYDWSAFIIPHSYPGEMDYQLGVEVGLLPAERNNPEAKVENKNVRDRANELIVNNSFYEVLLVNSKGEITEGSRSNLFGIKKNQLFTAPLNRVLQGITLLKTIEIINSGKMRLNFKCISDKELNDFDALFLTGTSLKILPIAKIGCHSFETQNEILQKLMTSYDDLIADDIQKRRDPD